MKLRLFVAITPPPDWKTALTELRKKLQPRFSNSFGKWTAETNLHLTLRFFGSVEESEVPAIGNALQKVSNETNPFTVLTGTLGCFPNASRPRILWLGLNGATENLIDLESRLRAATDNFGQPPDNREFHPHLTLARIADGRRSDRDLLAEFIRKGPQIESSLWTITALELVRSELRSTGAIYTNLASYVFQNASASDARKTPAKTD